MSGVVPIEYCRWCREHFPEGHACPYAPPPCPTEDGDTCGICRHCIDLQEADPRYGSPSDIEPPS